jgi:hypothetical protein
MNAVIVEIAAERERQITQEGWSLEHDDQHRDGSMAFAAASYIDPELYTPGWPYGESPRPVKWPRSWGLEWWKPKDRRRDLIRAAALLVAEIERLDRNGGRQ